MRPVAVVAVEAEAAAVVVEAVAEVEGKLVEHREWVVDVRRPTPPV